MKQYTPAFRPNGNKENQQQNVPFFEPQSYFKNAKPSFNKHLLLKWFAPVSGDFFLIAIKGVDAKMVNELLFLLKSKAHLNLDERNAGDIQEMMDVVKEFTKNDEPEPTSVADKTEQLPPSPCAENSPAFLKTVDEKIEENIGDDSFRGSDLARLLCCCEMQLYRKIKQLSNLSTANYIRKYRLHRSLQSLRKSDISISQICFNFGFRSLEYFSRSFKKEFGVCPTAFRSRQNVEIVQMNV